MSSACVIFISLALLTNQTFAAVKFWDINGATAGAGGATPTGTWDAATANWNDLSDGTGTAATFTAGDIAVFSAGTDATGSYTITGTGTAFVSVTNEDGIVTLSGTAFPLAGGTWTVKTGAQLRFSGSSAFPFTAGAGSAVVLDGGRIRNSVTGNAGNFLGAAVTANTAIIVTANGGTFDVSATNIISIIGAAGTTNLISGAGGITKVGVGVLALAGACTFSGSTTITAGEIRIRTTSNRLPTGTDVIVTSPGILNLNAVSQQIGSLTGTGDVGLSGATLTIGGTTSPAAFTGAIKTTANQGASGSTATGGNVTKQGTGTLTLAGPNAFTGLLTLTAGGINVTTTGVLCDPVCDLLVNGGTLSLTNSAQTIENLGGTGGTIVLNTGHTLTINPVNATRSSTFSGSIAGAGGITKIGAPTESLLGANTYTGPTIINVGKLITSTASTGAGSFTVADSTTLGVKVASVGTTLNLSDLTIGTSTLEFDFNALGYPTVKVANDAGGITVNGSVPVNVKGFDTSGGPVTLLEYSGPRSGAGSFTPGILPPRVVGTVTDDTANNRVTFNATGADSLIWVSDATGTWNVNNGANLIWKLASNSSATDYQETAVQGDTVRFDDTATGTATVALPGTVVPYSVTVDNSTTNYAFTGNGKISGPGKLVKNGTGELTISTTNDYAGGTTLNAGTINIGTDSVFGTGKLTINGGVLRSADITDHTSTTTVDLNANVNFGDAVKNGDLTFSTGPWTINGASRQLNIDTVNVTISSVVGQDVSGRGFIKNGSGTLSLTAANTFNGGVTLNAGTLRINNNSSVLANSPVSLANGVTIATTAGTARTLTGVYTVNGNFTLGQAAGGTAALTMAGSVNLGGATRTITVPNATDTISAVVTNGGLTKDGTGILILTSAANTYAGDSTINAGTLSVDADATFGNGTGTLVFNGGNMNVTADRDANVIANPISILSDAVVTTTSTAAAADCRFSSSSINVSAGRTLTLRNDGADGAADVFEVYFSGGGINYPEQLVIDNGAVGKTRLNLFNTNTDPAQTFSGVISGSGAVNRSASVTGTGGTTVFSGANTYSGGTTVNRGVLLVNNTSGSGTGSGTVTVSSGGTLGGTGTVNGAVVINASGIISAGVSAGILTLQNGLDLSAGGTNVWELAANSTNNAGTDFDQISLTGGNLALGGTSKLLIKFIGSATFPDATNTFWKTNRSWLVIAGSGGAANTGSTAFTTVTGAAGNNAGSFSTSADANGNVYLNFTVGIPTPPPQIDPTVVGAGTGNAQLSWSSVSGATYGVQYKTNLNQVGWLDLTNLTATGTLTAIIDNTSPSPKERYYRVISPYPPLP